MKTRRLSTSQTIEFDSEELVHTLAQRLCDKHAKDIHILDLRGLTDIADFFIVASATSKIHLKALSEDLLEIFDELGIKNYHLEGLRALQWVLADLYSIIIHLFLPETREFYDIEGYWGDAPVEILEESVEDAGESAEDVEE